MGENRIALNKGMSEAQTIKTLIHEVTHADLHAPEFQDKTVEKTSKHVKETEAESVAFVVCEHYGIDTSDYSFHKQKNRKHLKKQNRHKRKNYH